MFVAAIPGFEWLGTAIAHALDWIASTVGGNNYGVSIIFLTLLMRIVILPLSIKQTHSMMGMQKLQPKIKELQKKYKNDKEKQSQEMMALYKENKVSPLGGCLPLILQMPILFAVFDVLRSLSTKTGEYAKILDVSKESLNFFGMTISKTGNQLWQKPYNDYAQVIVLVLLTVVTGYISSKMLNQDPQQAKMMAMMPIMMGFFGWILPAGVTIYIITTNCFTIVQQYLQLEHACYFDDRQRDLRKLGHEASFMQKATLDVLSFGTKTMVSLKLRPKPKPPKKKKPVDGGKKNAQEEEATEQKKQPQGQKKPVAGKKPAAQGQNKSKVPQGQNKKPGNKKPGQGSKPAQKGNASKKPGNPA